MFHGSKTATALYVLGGLLALGEKATGVGFLLIGIAILYFVSCWAPRYKVNAMLLSGKGWVTSSTVMGVAAKDLAYGYRNAFAKFLWTIAFVIIAVPFLTINNFIKNYLVE